MKDWHWFIVLGSILITPLLPYILRARCPQCGRRKLQSLDTFRSEREKEATYITFHQCDHCKCIFRQEKSSPLKLTDKEDFETEAAVARERQLAITH